MRGLLLLFMISLWPGFVWAFQPAVLFDTWELDGGGYIESAYSGALTFEKFRKLPVSIITPDKHDAKPDPDFVNIVAQALEKGFNPIIAIGFPFDNAIRQLAPRYPDTSFIIIDAIIRGSNVQSIVFREEEGSFLVGYLAGMATRSRKVGFVGGMDCELIRKFGCAFAQGLHHLDPDIILYSVMTGDTVDAWNDPERGALLTRRLVEQGVDIIYHAAGMTGEGVIRTAADTGIMAIGVDTNQNHLAPGNMLSSMLKRMDVAVFLALSQAADGQWEPGVTTLGLKEGAIDWALDEHNIVLITEEMQDRMDTLTFDIIAGLLQVHINNQTEPCPYFDFDPNSKKPSSGPR